MYLMLREYSKMTNNIYYVTSENIQNLKLNMRTRKYWNNYYSTFKHWIKLLP